METTATTTGKQLLTHSRLACFRACPRRHYLQFELGIRPVTDGLPRRIGSAFHKALELSDKGRDVELSLLGLDDPFEAAMVAEMYVAHLARWNGSSLTAVASELPFDLPLINPDTGSSTPIWRMAGVIDRIVQLEDGRLALMEYKTTSRDFAPGAEYWQRLHLDQQLSIYVIAARELGYNVETVLYDVTRRPGQRPLKATPEASRKYTAKGALYANQRERDETPDEYGARIAADVVERPDHYFSRIEIARLDQDLDDCRAELWAQQKILREMQLAHRWYRNPGACFEPFACDYLPICQHRDLETRTPDGFVRSDEIHPELLLDATSEG